ncbi:MAG: IS66 family transposase, partial [Chloroflexi bacterium]|nr:IS66 family transposase [Chloroflexota bacterium]
PDLDYWSRLWLNWLIGRDDSDQDRRMGLEMWVRKALARNMPYDQFVAALLTAEGDVRENQAGNYLLRYDLSPIDLTSHASRLFLGLPMQCAQCHDHKTEEWLQEDFYGIAAFFTGMRREEVYEKDEKGRNRVVSTIIKNTSRSRITIPDTNEEISPRLLDGGQYQGSLTKRRQALSEWMTRKNNPYFSPAIVNRIWAYFMGKGFVEPLDGFGEEHPPSHPRLLDWLAEDFVIHNYDLQYLMRTVLNSKAYQRTSETNKSNKDDEIFHSHAYLKPLSAEQFFYSMLEATGFERQQKRRDRGQLEARKRRYLERFIFLLKNGEMEEIEAGILEKECPKCGGSLEHKEIDMRPIVDAMLIEAQKILYKCQVKKSCKCHSEVSNRPLVLPKHKYGNGLISNSIIMHYLEGIPLKRIENIWGNLVVSGNLIKIFHKLAEKWKPAVEQLKKDLREEPVIHADETGWRTDGHSGYSWLFCSDRLALFSFRETRSAKVVEEFLGTNGGAKRSGVLVVDRYAGYNQAPCKIQYCYEHLKRDLDLVKEFPKNKEVQRFGKSFRPLLCEAMSLRTKDISDKRFIKKAAKLKKNILDNIRAPASHLGIQNYQDIFRDNEDRLFHWADNRAVPAENNKAERELRPTIIARKVSFGSQSTKGAETRSIMMTVLHTAIRRLPDDKPITHWFNESMEKMIDNPDINPYLLLPKPP